MGAVFSTASLKTTLPRGGEAAGFGLPAKLAYKRHRLGQLDLLGAPVVRPLGGQQCASRQVPDVPDEDVPDRPIETMTGGDLEGDRLSRGFPCGEGH